jgi:hypothetical protein
MSPRVEHLYLVKFVKRFVCKSITATYHLHSHWSACSHKGGPSCFVLFRMDYLEIKLHIIFTSRKLGFDTSGSFMGNVKVIM